MLRIFKWLMVILCCAGFGWAVQQRQPVTLGITAQAAPTRLPTTPADWHGQIDYRAIDARITALMLRPEMTGLAVAIVEDGRLSFVKGYGLASAETGEAVRPDTVFRWASLSKSVAGTLSAKLDAAGVLSLADPIGKYQTSLRLPNGGEARLPLADLLAQRSGLVKHAYDEKLEDGGDPRLIRASLQSVPTRCAPGTCYTYQNIAFDAASEVISAATGKTYASDVKTQLFRPLQMQNASTGIEALFAAKHWARPYRHGKPLPVLPSYYRIPAAAGVNSTIVDLAKWMQAQMGEQPDVLTPAMLQMVQMPRVKTERLYGNSAFGRAFTQPGYGLGMRSFIYAGHPLVGHSGAVSGYRSTMMFDPATKTGVVMLWNSDDGKPFRLQPEVFDSYYGLPFTDWLELPPPVEKVAAES